jgi:hypothetical protein
MYNERSKEPGGAPEHGSRDLAEIRWEISESIIEKALVFVHRIAG